MGDLVQEIVEAIQTSLVDGVPALQQTLKLDAVPTQTVGNVVTFTIPRPQKLDRLLNQPNNIRVPESERKTKAGTTVTVRSYRRKTSKPTVAKAVKACEADEDNTQQTNDAISAFIMQRIEHGLRNVKSASL